MPGTDNEKMKKTKAILSIRAKTLKSARTWLNQQAFTEVHPPMLIPAVGERPGCFQVEYFKKKAYLGGGLQPYSYTFLKYFPKIYTIAPAFRAEKTKTKRHLTEYWRIDVAANNMSLEQSIEVQENLLTRICHDLARNANEELNQLNRSPEDLSNVKHPFPRLTYDQAIETLQKQGQNIQWGDPLSPETENKLSLKYKKPFFITLYPISFETFFHKSHPKNPDLTLTADLLAPEGYGEIASSGQMIANQKTLRRKMAEAKIEPKDQEWYLGLVGQNSKPQTGFAIGLERLIRWVCKLQNITEATAFPRTYESGYP